MQTDYVDLLLMHWPVNGLYNATWWAMEEIYAAGKAKAIGVCNFNVERLSDLLDNGSVVPAVNQIEFNPGSTRMTFATYAANTTSKWKPGHH